MAILRTSLGENKIQFQNFFDPGVGPRDVTTYTQFVVATVPLKLNDSWNLFVRTQLPLMNQPTASPARAPTWSRNVQLIRESCA